MTLQEYMTWKTLRDHELAAAVEKLGVVCDRSTITRLRHGQIWLGNVPLARAIKKVTQGHVTANDFCDSWKGRGNGATQKTG